MCLKGSQGVDEGRTKVEQDNINDNGDGPYKKRVNRRIEKGTEEV